MLIFDLESNGFLRELTKIHCLVVKDSVSENVTRYRWDGIYEAVRALTLVGTRGEKLVGHNVINFDIPALKKVYPSFNVPQSSVLDTLVLSRLIYPDLGDMDTRLIKKGKLPSKYFKRHSLEAWGHRLGLHKGDFKGPWDTWTQEMEDYCVQDVAVTEKLLEFLLKALGVAEEWPQAVEIEHGVAWILARQERRGFKFDSERAAKLLSKLVQLRLEEEVKLKSIFPPFYVKDGQEFLPKRDNAKVGYTAGAPIQKLKMVEFNPGSRHHIAMMLTRRYGWEPQEFTNDGHAKVDETVLGGLKYPEAKQLTRYLTLNKRIGQLHEGDEAWLRHVVNGRIHGSVIGNGAVTGRMTHMKPNMAQVPAGYSPFGRECRECFTAEGVLVGVDAAALELRGLAGYMARYDGGAYIKTVLEGNKAEGTDIHSVNARALGLDPKKEYHSGESGRDLAKTWFYAFVYGAGDEKLGAILTKKKGQPARLKGASTRAAFMRNLPALGRLVEAVQAAVKKRGYLIGLDGRKLHIRSSHAALNTLLQSAGAVQMKKALLILDGKPQALGMSPGVDYEFVANVHDEWQIEVSDPLKGDLVGQTAVQSIKESGEWFGFRCPLDGEYRVGRNWSETH